MRLMDIHSHILPEVDDGAKDLETSVQLLQQMYQQGITDVIATPHFYAMFHSIEEYSELVTNAYLRVREATKGLDVPNLSLGSEVFYFTGIGKSQGVKALTLCHSDYILLELPTCKIDADILRDIRDLNDRLGLVPILAHLERFATERGFKEILKLIDEGFAVAQVNASSLVSGVFKKQAQKLVRKGYISYIATDTHSPDHRPPLMKDALEAVARDFGQETADVFRANSNQLCEEIFVVPGEML
ncbi:MAG: hypothetical protein MJ132_05765 [Clostridia bacterium]|nr:hypothetical protein [Clostridia bacterium]